MLPQRRRRPVPGQLLGLEPVGLALAGPSAGPARRRAARARPVTWPASSLAVLLVGGRVARVLHPGGDDEHREGRHHQRAERADAATPRPASLAGGGAERPCGAETKA